MFPIRNMAKVVITLFLILLCLPLFRQGMYIDGVWYAAIAKNMAAGLGSIWDPALSKTMFLHFREHPPLAIAMQSIFFQLLGDGFWVERLYCMLLGMFQIFVVFKLWNQDLNSKRVGISKTSLLWFLLLWLMIPVNIGMYKNNLLEAGLTLFSTLACFGLIRNFQSTSAFMLASLFSSICLIAGFMCNGPTVLFPLAIPFLHGWLIDRQPMKLLITRTLLLTVIAGLSFLFFFILFPDALLNLKGYFKIQLMAAITGKRDLSYTGLGHFHIVTIYFQNYIWLSLTGLVAIALQARVSQQSFIKLLTSHSKSPWFRFYFLLSLCASLPVGISHRQDFHYIAASSPIVLLGMMHLTHHSFLTLAAHMEAQPITVLSKNIRRLLTVILVSSLAVVVHKSGGYNRDQKLIEDVKQVAAFLPKGQLIKGSPQTLGNFDVPLSFARYSFVSFLDPNNKNDPLSSQYYVYYPNESLPSDYEPVEMGLRFFRLARLSVSANITK